MFEVLLKIAHVVLDKVKKKYGSLGHSVLAVQLERGRQGLGLSLAGHKDRSRMAVFVCGLNPNGAASRSGSIQVGDEILEVTNFVFSFVLPALHLVPLVCTAVQMHYAIILSVCLLH
jgi:hypothetical protein